MSRQFFDDQKQTVLERLPQVAGKGMTKALDPLFDMAEAIEKLALLYRPIYGDEIDEAAKSAMILVSASPFDEFDPAIARFMESRSNKVSKAVNAETDKQLRAELAGGIANGESIEELTARIEKVYGAAAGFRAERIARSETIKAENWASIQAWKQSGVVDRKEWFTAEDERVCQFCGPMDGRVIDLGGKYFANGDEYQGSDGGKLKLDFESITQPPLHAQCRCTLLPVLSDD